MIFTQLICTVSIDLELIRFTTEISSLPLSVNFNHFGFENKGNNVDLKSLVSLCCWWLTFFFLLSISFSVFARPRRRRRRQRKIQKINITRDIARDDVNRRSELDRMFEQRAKAHSIEHFTNVVQTSKHWNIRIECWMGKTFDCDGISLLLCCCRRREWQESADSHVVLFLHFSFPVPFLLTHSIPCHAIPEKKRNEREVHAFLDEHEPWNEKKGPISSWPSCVVEWTQFKEPHISCMLGIHFRMLSPLLGRLSKLISPTYRTFPFSHGSDVLSHFEHVYSSIVELNSTQVGTLETLCKRRTRGTDQMQIGNWKFNQQVWLHKLAINIFDGSFLSTAPFAKISTTFLLLILLQIVFVALCCDIQSTMGERKIWISHPMLLLFSSHRQHMLEVPLTLSQHKRSERRRRRRHGTE